MMINLPADQRVWHIGDPHLGRRFETGVPLNRRGEREARQLAKFKAELATDCDVNIMVGDLFDHPQVSLATILEAADAYFEAAAEHPDTQFIIMAGNHDRSRNLGAVGAWEIFSRLINERADNLIIVDYEKRLTLGEATDAVIVPWRWGTPVAEQVEAIADGNLFTDAVQLVVLHHDLESFGGDGSYLVPAKTIRERFPNAKIVTGHWHLEGAYVVDGVEVTCTGSLEPYTHAEDPTGELYVTLTLDELQAADAATLRDKCVRVLLKEGEELPVELDCLALTAKRVTEEETESVAEKMGAFDWQAILDECLKDVPSYVREFIDERLHPS